MGYWAKDGSFVREASDDAPRMTQGDTWEAGQRVIKGMQDWEEQEKRRKTAEKQSRIEFYEMQKREENKRINEIKYQENKREAVRIIVDQKRQEYNKKSWFGKSIAKLTGQTFAKMRNGIEENAMKRVQNMSPEYLERFIENNFEEKGRSR